MEELRSLIEKELETVIPITNRASNNYVTFCFNSNSDEKSYAKCITKRLAFMRQKEG